MRTDSSDAGRRRGTGRDSRVRRRRRAGSAPARRAPPRAAAPRRAACPSDRCARCSTARPACARPRAAVAARYANAIAFCSISLTPETPGSSPRSSADRLVERRRRSGRQGFLRGHVVESGGSGAVCQKRQHCQYNQPGKRRCRRVTGRWTRAHCACHSLARMIQTARESETGQAIVAARMRPRAGRLRRNILKYRVAYRLAQEQQQQDPPANRPPDRKTAVLAR